MIRLALILGAVLLLAIQQPAKAADRPGPLVQTTEGPVQGFVANGMNQFLGIPFATPPVGAARWPSELPHLRDLVGRARAAYIAEGGRNPFGLGPGAKPVDGRTGPDRPETRIGVTGPKSTRNQIGPGPVR